MVRFGVVRVGTGLCVALAGMWAARCLGPQKLGISAMVLALVSQGVILMGLLPDALLVRRSKELGQTEAKLRLFDTVMGFRLMIAAGVGCLGVLWLLSGDRGAGVFLASVMGMLVLAARALVPQWSFQAEGQMQRFAWLEVAQAAGILALYGILMRPGVMAGTDLAAQAATGLVASAFMAWWARRSLLDNVGDARVGAKFMFLWPVAGDLLRAGRWLIVMQAMIYVYVNFEVVLVGYWGGVESAGLYRTAQSWTQAATMLWTIPPLLLFPRFVEWRRKSPALLWRRQRQLAMVAGLIAIFGTALAVLVVPPMHRAWFGPSYEAAAWPAAVLLAAKMLVLINGVLGWGVMANPAMDRSMALLMGGVAFFSLSGNCLLVRSHGMMAAACVNFGSEFLIMIGTYLLAKRSVLGRKDST